MELTPDRPVAGGRMLARHEGRVVLVAGAIPGERVRVRVERVVARRHVRRRGGHPRSEPRPPRAARRSRLRRRRLRAHPVRPPARAQGRRHRRRVSAHRQGRARRPGARCGRRPSTGIACGRGCTFGSGARASSAKARTVLCDAGATGQLLPETMTALDAVLAAIDARLAECDALVVSENIAATERVIHLEPRDGARLDDLAGRVPLPPGLTGLTTGRHGHATTLAGSGAVTDRAAQLFGDDPPIDPATAWTRQATSFFQGNRFLTGALVRHVLEAGARRAIRRSLRGRGLVCDRAGGVAARAGSRSKATDRAPPISRRTPRRWPDRLRVAARVRRGGRDACRWIRRRMSSCSIRRARASGRRRSMA